MKAGFAERDITPEPGMEKPGGYRKAYHTDNFHDPCKIRASVFDDGQTRASLVGIDTLAVPRSLVQSARAIIEQACGIPPSAILVGASHSHSAGPLGMVLPGEYDHASPLVRHLAYGVSSCADPRYIELVEHELVAAVMV